MSLKRFFTATAAAKTAPKWPVKQVTKSNFAETLEELKTYISDSDYIAVSLQNTGTSAAAWHRPQPFDVADTAYHKAKFAAERFQVLQFAVCPFSIRTSPSKIVAHPYNFHLFPRAELKLGVPSYTFSCQISNLTSMAREGFDFNACIYDGISYLSREQESAVQIQTGNVKIGSQVIKSSSSSPSIADTIFVGRVKSRVTRWRNSCKESCNDNNNNNNNVSESLVKSIRKLLLGSERYGSRPCLNIDVCNERQVQLVLEILTEFSDDIVPLIIPAKSLSSQVVCVVFISSSEDMDDFKKEHQNLEEEQNKRIRGFREVIDMISASQKPVVSHNSLNDFTFVHSKFVATLPPNMDQFLCSLRSIFPHIVDINHLMMQISPPRKTTNLPSAASYLTRRFIVPIDIDIPQGIKNEGKTHGQNVLRISHLFAKLCSLLKILPNSLQPDNSGHLGSSLLGYANIFNPCCASSRDPLDKDVRIWAGNTRKVSSNDLVFLWGFGGGMSAGVLKSLLCGSHDIFSEEFDIRLVDNSCAIVVFWQSGMSKTFLEVMGGAGIGLSGTLKEMVSEGLRVTGYETYRRACSLGFWENNLADSLDKVVSEDPILDAKPSEIYWNDYMIDFDKL